MTAVLLALVASLRAAFRSRAALQLEVLAPSTMIAWQRRRFRDHWGRLSRARPGRPAVAKAVQELIRKMSSANPG